MKNSTVNKTTTVEIAFHQFCKNITLPTTTVKKIRQRYQRIVKQLNKDFWGQSDSAAHCLYVGSYGRDTDIFVSDIDVLFWLPKARLARYQDRITNGASGLLQDLKNSIKRTYTSTSLRADGQVVVAPFNDKVRFEIVPCFEQTDKSFIYPDTNQGGSWRKTDPRPEIEAVNAMDKKTNGLMKNLCRMTRAWKQKWNVPISGLLIDTLVYNFLNQWKPKSGAKVRYDHVCRDFFKFLSEQNPEQKYWLALGSRQHVERTGLFEYKAKRCYNLALEAIEKEKFRIAHTKWRQIYGNKFPA